MRKVSLLLLTVLGTCTLLNAQKKSLGKKTPDWGIRMGANVSTLNMDKDPLIELKWRTGYVAGVFFRIKVNSCFSVQPEFLYSSMGAKSEHVITGSSVIRLNYFSIPVMAKYKFAKQWAVVLGPQVDFLMNAKQVQDEETSDLFDFEDHSINATGGIEFWPIKNIGLSGRYIYGISNISSTDKNIRNQGVQITLAVKL